MLLKHGAREEEMPQVSGVIETALYVDDLDRASCFYDTLFAFPRLLRNDRLCAYDVAGRSILLLFKRGASLHLAEMSGGLPSHDGSGPIHAALATTAETLADWEEHLHAHGIRIEGRKNWPRGRRSIYFRDPDGHLLELATPGTWATY
jgi:catechol 2,3-dioxygenase-like lactoylglutathione lyase family enzyme